ncbi:MAG TPA: CHASE3 domain-containing protein [Holophagaceae bacterium]|nr:CHASE3 domain-containing protein [Holophagaceae bacterium]
MAAAFRDLTRPGEQGFHQAWSALAIFLALLLLSAGAWGLHRNQLRYAELDQWRVHTQEVLRSLNSVMSHAMEAESATRGYALSGLPERRREALLARQATDTALDETQRLVADNPEQETALSSLREDLARRFALADQLQAARDQGGLPAAAAFAGTGSGAQTMAKVRSLHQQMVEREEALLVQRRNLALAKWRQTLRATILYAAFALLLGLGGAMLLRRDRILHQRLEAEQARLLRILEETPDFIGMAAADGEILYHNRAFRELRGLGPMEPLGALDPPTLSRFYAPASLPVIQLAIQEARAGQVWTGEPEMLDAGGQPVPVSQVVLPHVDRAGRVTHLSTIARDIRAQRAAERMKDEFIATVSHELRTPLTSIKGALGLLSGGTSGELPPSARTLLGIAGTNTERLIRLINDILDMGRIEAGKLEINARPLDLDAVVAQALESTAPYFAELEVRCDWQPGAAGAKVLADEGRLVQVLVNLLSNAAKFSPKEEPVEVRTLRAGGHLRVEVVNGGPGIPEHFRIRVFEKFAQADSSDRRSRSGSGLGLSIARTLTERMGGALGFESAPGRTCFWLAFPEYLR